MYSLKLRRRKLARLPLVHFYGVLGVLRAFLEQPDDSLGARLFKPSITLEVIILDTLRTDLWLLLWLAVWLQSP